MLQIKYADYVYTYISKEGVGQKKFFFAFFQYCIYTYIRGGGQKCLKTCLRIIWMAPKLPISSG